ncbi:MAG: hypothetical protein ABI746_11280 [Dermatophilaceae bacterium]
MSESLAPWAREILRCPVCRGRLEDATSAEGQPALRCAADCDVPGMRRLYRIDEGIPVLLADEARLERT